jgi:uroporphyrin-III C-methyltransferase
MGIVHLTGAGPGDIELLTLKAARVIREADIIIYDRLANPDILKMAKNGCEFIYVGKEDGHHSMPQDDINEVIYQNALKYETVVRLKGGDPFVFGRGGEEASYLYERDIKFDIIPGITSAVSAPAYAGIPVTHRGVAVSFRVVTRQ